MKPASRTVLLVIGSLLFGYLFYNAEPGINYLLFICLGIAAIGQAQTDRGGRFPATPVLAALLLACSTGLYGSAWHSILFWPVWLMAPAVLVVAHFSVPSAVFAGVVNQLSAPFLYIRNALAAPSADNGTATSRSRWLTFGAAILILVFGYIYLNTSAVMQNIFSNWTNLFNASFLGMSLVGALVLMAALAPNDILTKLSIQNRDPGLLPEPPPPSPLDMQQERTIAQRLLTALIVLALAPALADVASLAGLLPVSRDATITADVHQSVTLLMVGCGLVAGLAAFVFRHARHQPENGTTQKLFYYFYWPIWLW